MSDSSIEKVLGDAVQSAGLGAHLPFIRSLLGLAIQLSATDNARSAVGGRCLVPEGFKWPVHERGRHTCIAQIDCAELPATTRLPGSGLLTFFAAHDPDGDSWAWLDEFMQIHLFEDSASLRPASDQFPAFPRRPVSFDLTWSLPFNQHLRDDWPWDEGEHDDFEYGVSDAMGDAVVNTCGDFLLGHAPGSRIWGDPSPGRDWELLLLLRYDEELEMYWGDDSALMVFIESEALTRLDFSSPKCAIG